MLNKCKSWLKIFDQTIPSAPKKAKSLQNNSSLVHEAEVKVKYFQFGLWIEASLLPSSSQGEFKFFLLAL